ncbi:hypothetical protein [Streptomyces sp. NPDC058371]|uniref:hypothetical protein n=1 Tax=Streptomyces sp. NPDC058371 TaxID=3346463 RepID=UPI003667BF32
MRRIPKRLWLPLAGLLALGLVAAVLVRTQDDEGGHLAANRAQLKNACGGLLPYGELRGAVPDQVPGTLDEYGTLLEPAQESRSLVNCTLAWQGHGSLQVQAVALASHLPYELKTKDLLAEGYEAPGITGRYTDEGGRLWVVAECPKGLTGRVRPVSQMYVTVALEKASIRKSFRVAVAVADAITKRQNCGSRTPLKAPARVIDTYEEHFDGGKDDYEVDRIDEPGRGVKKCRWISDRRTAPLRGTWITSGDLQESRLLDACQGTRWDELSGEYTDPEPAELEPSSLDAASWSGELGLSAYRDYRRDGDAPGITTPSPGKYTDTKAPESLALWARSQCAGGATYHRVSIRPTLDTQVEEGDEVLLTPDQRAQLSRSVRKVMDSYLTSEGGWPKTQHCHDTELLGEVEE